MTGSQVICRNMAKNTGVIKLSGTVDKDDRFTSDCRNMAKNTGVIKLSGTVDKPGDVHD